MEAKYGVAGSRPRGRQEALESCARLTLSQTLGAPARLADAQEEAGDLLMAEHEVAPGPDALVAAVHMLTRRTGSSGVGMALGWLADGHPAR